MNVSDQSERDVAFTPFMLRVRGVLDGTEPVPGSFALRPSELRSRAATVDTWFYLRTRAEQVVAEANAMLEGRAPLFDLEDESGSGRLAFVVRHGSRWMRLRIDHVDPRTFLELDGTMVSSAAPMEPVDHGALDDLVIGLLKPT
jgi:hypothetical protein